MIEHPATAHGRGGQRKLPRRGVPRRLAALTVSLCVPFLAGWIAAEEAARDESAVTRTHGPYAIGIPPRKLTVEITTRTLPAAEWPMSDECMTVRDEGGAVLLHRDYPVTGDLEMHIVLDVLELSGRGKALLVMREFSPATPGSGVDGQLFGLNGDGRLVPMTGAISPHKNDADAANFRVVRSGRGEARRVMVEVEEWTGNFTVLRHYAIAPDGVASDEPVAERESRTAIRIDGAYAARKRIEIENEIGNEIENEGEPFVTLRGDPTFDGPSVKIAIGPSSKIEFLDAVLADGQWFLRVRIDGREGYVTGDGSFDLDRLGLPTAG